MKKLQFCNGVTSLWRRGFKLHRLKSEFFSPIQNNHQQRSFTTISSNGYERVEKLNDTSTLLIYPMVKNDDNVLNNLDIIKEIEMKLADCKKDEHFKELENNYRQIQDIMKNIESYENKKEESSKGNKHLEKLRYRGLELTYYKWFKNDLKMIKNNKLKELIDRTKLYIDFLKVWEKVAKLQKGKNLNNPYVTELDFVTIEAMSKDLFNLSIPVGTQYKGLYKAFLNIVVKAIEFTVLNQLKNKKTGVVWGFSKNTQYALYKQFLDSKDKYTLGKALWNIHENAMFKPFYRAGLPPVKGIYKTIVSGQCKYIKNDNELITTDDTVQFKEYLNSIKSTEKNVKVRTIYPHFDQRMQLDDPTLNNKMEKNDFQSMILNRIPISIKSRFYDNPKRPKGVVLLSLHGGGFFAMSSFGHESYTRRWCNQTGVPVVCVDYTLAPGEKYPFQIDECQLVYEHILNNPNLYLPHGESLEKIIICGDSAGGSLTIDLTMRLLSQTNIKSPGGLILTYPASNLLSEVSAHRLQALTDPLLNVHMLQLCQDLYLNIDEQVESNPFISFSKVPDCIIKCFPPTFLSCGTQDPLFDESLMVASRLVHNGVPLEFHVLEGIGHGFLNLYEFLPDTKKIIRNQSDWILKQ